MTKRGLRLLGMVFDLIGTALIVLYALMIGPLGVFRGIFALESLFWYLWILLPLGLLTQTARAAIDWRLGRFDAAITQWESLTAVCEAGLKDQPTSRAHRRVLEDLYTALARAYMHVGHIDDAMMVVIRAKKVAGFDRLPGLNELDAKSAHLVRAGLAAGRLLDGQGLATMFVKTSQPPAPQDGASSRKGASVHSGKESAPSAASSPSSPLSQLSTSSRDPFAGKVIPFRSPAPLDP